ncbi:Hypothetical_protein [Hexamita inflata]|uniref:Hypothetical_protein n=1 Tax=Hexamita inflata TaxID=28002 RepID=A0AA86TQ55_9EUKA|nr:Hypothetical protein HINF_LOCUS10292 [Hexamita inflata]
MTPEMLLSSEVLQTCYQYYITSNADPRPYSLTDPVDFPKNIKGSISESKSGCFQLIFYFRFGFPFQLQTPFLKIFFKYQHIFEFNVYNDLNSTMYQRLFSFLVYVSLKTRQNLQYLINQISNHFSYRPQIQFRYTPFYSQILMGSVTERFWGLQVNRGWGSAFEVLWSPSQL